MGWLPARIVACTLLVLVVGASAPPLQQSGSARAPWQPDNGDGTYSNPVLFADYSDPDAIRVGDDFYMTASSFQCVPGLPILHSRDLVNWRLIGHALPRLAPATTFAKPQHGNGVWAPAIRYHSGHFYIVYGDPDFGIYMVKARHPTGQWSAPHLLRAAKGWIDPSPFWDDDGKAYLIRAWARSRSGVQSILTLHRMRPDATGLLDDGQTVFDGHANHPTIEGPKLYKRNGYYYIFAPAGGVTNGWQTVLRSRNIYGPYEDRIVLNRGATEINGPHQGAWVESASGESWFVHFQDRGPYGRVVHLQPLRWVNDWPVIGNDADGDGKGEPVMRFAKPKVKDGARRDAPQTSDEFSARALGLQWQWHANPAGDWLSLSKRGGWLRLPAQAAGEDAANLWTAPNLLLQKLPALQFTVTTRVDFTQLKEGERAGLVMMGVDYAYLAVAHDDGASRIIHARHRNAPDGGVPVFEDGAALTNGTVLLRAQVSEGAETQFSYSVDGVNYLNVGPLFPARAGRWIGAKIGLFALADSARKGHGWADFDWFRVE